MGILDPKPPTRAELSATYAQQWKANTAYAAGQPVVNPSGDVVTAKAAFTSGATYDPTKWNKASTGDTMGTALRKKVDGTSVTISTTGHSLMYGASDATGYLPAANGAPNTRSKWSPPESLNDMLNYVLGGAARTVLNNAYPGDRSREVLSRWVAGNSGDVEIIWADTNDAKNYGNFADGPLAQSETRDNISQLIKRAQDRGAQPIVIGGAPVASRGDTGKIFAATEAQRQIADRLGVPFVNVAELLNVIKKPSTIWRDGVHFTDEAYAAIGTRLAALFGPRGANPLKVAPGTRILPSHNEHTGSPALNTRANAYDGQTIGLTAGGASLTTVAVNAVAPCDVIVWLYAEPGSAAAGTGVFSTHRLISRITGINKRCAQVGTYGAGCSVPVRIATLNGGPDVIFLGVDSGTVEIEAIEFVPPRQGGTLPTTSRTLAKSDLTGVRVGDNNAALGVAESMFDPRACFGLTGTAGTLKAARADFTVKLAANTTAGKVQAVAIAAGLKPASLTQINGGYAILRDGTTLKLREFNGTGVSDLFSVTNAFPSTAAWTGDLSFVFDTSGNLSVYVDGVAVGTPQVTKFRQFVPGAFADQGFPLTVLGCSVVADADAI